MPHTGMEWVGARVTLGEADDTPWTIFAAVVGCLCQPCLDRPSTTDLVNRAADTLRAARLCITTTANAAVPPAVALTKRSGMCVSRSGESPMILCVSRPGESPLHFCVSRIGESPSFLQVFHRVLFEVGSDLQGAQHRKTNNVCMHTIRMNGECGYGQGGGSMQGRAGVPRASRPHIAQR